MRFVIACLVSIFASSASMADTITVSDFLGLNQTPTFDIPSEPNTGGFYFAAASGAGGNTPIYGYNRPCFSSRFSSAKLTENIGMPGSIWTAIRLRFGWALGASSDGTQGKA